VLADRRFIISVYVFHRDLWAGSRVKDTALYVEISGIASCIRLLKQDDGTVITKRMNEIGPDLRHDIEVIYAN
jgi:hypothetical protein